MAIVKFGDIVRDVKINVDRANNPYEHYVAGDHMDSEDLTIHRYGSFETDDVGPAFTRIFKPGQILYGSRRTYLKKVAVADFEGICANTTFVLESKDEALFDNRLLPFIMLSDAFTRWSIAHSKGSTNPYVLFSDLADYEFDLPPLAEQKVLADKLWAAYRLKESYKKLLVATEEMVKSQFIEMFGGVDNNPKSYDIKKVGDFAECFAGATPSTKIPSYWDNGNIPWMSSGEVHKGRVQDTDAKITQQGYDGCSTKMVPIHSIVVALAGQGKTRGTVAINDIELCTNQSLCAIVPNEEVNYEYLFHNLRGRYKELRSMSGDVDGRGGLNLKHIQSIKVIVPPMSEQMKFVSIARQADKSGFDGRKSQFIEMFGCLAERVALSSLCDTFIDGDWIEAKDQSGSGIRLIQTGNVGVGTFKDKGDRARYISEETFNRLNCTEVVEGDILISRLPEPVGRACIIPAGLGKSITAVDCTIIRLNDKVLPKFFVAFTNTPDYAMQIKKVLSGTTRLRVSRANLGKIQVPLPSIDKQQQFVTIAEQADKSGSGGRESVALMGKVKKSLINYYNI